MYETNNYVYNIIIIHTYCDSFIKIAPLCSQRDDYSMHTKCAVCEHWQYWSQYIRMTCRRCYMHFTCCYIPLFSNNPKASLMCHISLAIYYWKQDKWFSNSTPFKQKHTFAWSIFSYIHTLDSCIWKFSCVWSE